jgi:uncharacterized protein
MTTPNPAPVDALSPDDFDALDTILDDLRQRDDEVPQWEFCEGFLAAVICCREPITDHAAMDALFPEFEGEEPLFASDEQRQQFAVLWARRRAELAASLAVQVESLADDAAFSPEVMDVRGAVYSLPEAERTQWEADNPGDAPMPSFAQIWALGFMYAVEHWEDAWEAPRDKDTATWLSDSIEKIVVLTEDDTGVPFENMYDEERPTQRQRSPPERLRRSALGCVRPEPDLAQPGAQGGHHHQGPRTRPQRPLFVREWQKIQEVLRGLNAG